MQILIARYVSQNIFSCHSSSVGFSFYLNRHFEIKYYMISGYPVLMISIRGFIIKILCCICIPTTIYIVS
jgi:hypothetical protein